MARARLVQIVNRTTLPLDCMFDGIPEVIKPGYVFQPNGETDANGRELGDVVPAGADGKPSKDGEPYGHSCTVHEAECYKRQHPIMGTQDPNSTDSRDTEYLLGVEAWGDEIDHVEQSDAIELLDRSQLPDDRQNIRVRQVSGARRVPTKGSKLGRKAKLVARERRRQAYTDRYLKNPCGIKAAYD